MLEQKVEQLTAAIVALTAALTQQTALVAHTVTQVSGSTVADPVAAQTAKTPAREKATVTDIKAEKPAAKVESKKAEKAAPIKADVMNAASKAITKKGRDAVIKLLADKFNSSNVSGLAEDKYAEAIQELDKLAASEAA